MNKKIVKLIENIATEIDDELELYRKDFRCSRDLYLDLLFENSETLQEIFGNKDTFYEFVDDENIFEEIYYEQWEPY